MKKKTLIVVEYILSFLMGVLLWSGGITFMNWRFYACIIVYALGTSVHHLEDAKK